MFPKLQDKLVQMYGACSLSWMSWARLTYGPGAPGNIGTESLPEHPTLTSLQLCTPELLCSAAGPHHLLVHSLLSQGLLLFLYCCHIYPSCCCVKIPWQRQLKKGRVYLPHSLRWSPWGSQGSRRLGWVVTLYPSMVGKSRSKWMLVLSQLPSLKGFRTHLQGMVSPSLRVWSSSLS